LHWDRIATSFARGAPARAVPWFLQKDHCRRDGGSPRAQAGHPGLTDHRAASATLDHTGPNFPVEQMMRDATITQIDEGTNQIQRVVMSRALLR
jgi:alkylation response protein AidB-like acyl-CoA dehydrogenase